MITRFNHLHLICGDMETMIQFFTRTLGGKLLGRMKFGPADGAQVELGGTTINLRVRRDDEQIPDPPAGSRYGYDHIGLEVVKLGRSERPNACRNNPTFNVLLMLNSRASNVKLIA